MLTASVPADLPAVGASHWLLVCQIRVRTSFFFFARSCLGKVPGRAPFSQRSERATACTIRMQIDKQINVQDELNKAKQQISQY